VWSWPRFRSNGTLAPHSEHYHPSVAARHLRHIAVLAQDPVETEYDGEMLQRRSLIGLPTHTIGPAAAFARTRADQFGSSLTIAAQR
jgi:hypothetical protein